MLGIEPDELEVALAVRMSMSIPIFFEAVEHVNEKTNHEHVIVDGGMLSNFPVWLFDSRSDEVPRLADLRPAARRARPEDRRSPSGCPSPSTGHTGSRGSLRLLSSMVHTMMEAHDRLYVEKAQYARTIPIPTLGVGTTEFDLPPERAQALYESGRQAAEKFLETWDFQAYITEFRSGKPHSRREAIGKELQEAKKLDT